MPSAGAVYPPVITPLRRTLPGKPGNFISTSTYIEIETGAENYSDCVPYEFYSIDLRVDDDKDDDEGDGAGCGDSDVDDE